VFAEVDALGQRLLQRQHMQSSWTAVLSGLDSLCAGVEACAGGVSGVGADAALFEMLAEQVKLQARSP